jgi:AraC-like DNA-binding protein
MDKSQFINSIIKYILCLDLDELSSLKVRELSKKFGFNYTYLSRKFKINGKFTLSEFIQREKMLRTAILLRERKDLAINEVAEKMGFSSVEYFIKAFKKHIGISPGKYQKFVKSKQFK